jgi:hypothetical protein
MSLLRDHRRSVVCQARSTFPLTSQFLRLNLPGRRCLLLVPRHRARKATWADHRRSFWPKPRDHSPRHHRLLVPSRWPSHPTVKRSHSRPFTPSPRPLVGPAARPLASHYLRCKRAPRVVAPAARRMNLGVRGRPSLVGRRRTLVSLDRAPRRPGRHLDLPPTSTTTIGRTLVHRRRIRTRTRIEV